MTARKGNISKSARMSVLRRDQYTCKGCGKFDPSGDDLTIDHMTPKTMGGVNAQWNLQILCHTCNGEKGNKTMKEWLDDKEAKAGT